ncbi:AraC family transcriptional regulator [Burkholderia sp. FERM BP-3421]|jgi:AraC-like DNA-binding protein|uniref:helix-turn-helix domain-containing protein n=1 Tax=Burkholderia sp. FERM BP-3421 TaxID=1494466 RepID=UPI002360CB00|nr:AraC family transcriptional regulator [Burkholderia sp. FERM BP-3421]WDD92891.1 AraC family transcriptional regulator [Burkholderia sp. FERM BP-3421]
MEAALASPTVSLRRYGQSEASDVHDFHQIVLGVDGAMVMSVDGVDARIDRHSAWLVPAGARHAYAGLGANRQLVLDLPAASLAVPARLFERARTLRLEPALGVLAAELAGHAEAGGRRFHWQAAARLCDALVATLGETAPTARAGGLAVARIDRWLRAHLAEPLRVADLAAHCGFGLRRFHALFCDAFGETPHQYLRRLRLDTALLLLDDPGRPLADIAIAVGFADQSALTHAFTGRFGLAPGQWRNLRH